MNMHFKPASRNPRLINWNRIEDEKDSEGSGTG